MMNKEKLKDIICQGLVCDYIEIQGDDGRHFHATIVSPAFEGLSMVKQHKMVYATLGQLMQTDEVHALALKTFSPSKWDAQK